MRLIIFFFIPSRTQLEFKSKWIDSYGIWSKNFGMRLVECMNTFDWNFMVENNKRMSAICFVSFNLKKVFKIERALSVERKMIQAEKREGTEKKQRVQIRENRKSNKRLNPIRLNVFVTNSKWYPKYLLQSECMWKNSDKWHKVPYLVQRARLKFDMNNIFESFSFSFKYCIDMWTYRASEWKREGIKWLKTPIKRCVYTERRSRKGKIE